MAERERNITSIFHSAIAREPHERAPYLDGACGNDEALRREVEALIRSHESAGSFIESPAFEHGAGLLEERAGALTGQSVGQFRVLSLLGAGGMGEVYLAQDTKLDRKVALKVLRAEVAGNQDRMRRFVQEAKSAAALNHPNIAHIYEIGEAAGLRFIAMEFIEGVTLREKIHQEKTELRVLLRYLQQVAEGVSRAHATGIVHRDLKPDNIMITRDGYAKILDFGLAKLIDQRPAAMPAEGSSEVATAVMVQHSTPGMVMGTVGYMSPEQAQGKTKEIDHRSDIFSFGCILFEAATRRKPFEGRDILDSLHNIVHALTPSIREINPSAPDDLQRVVRRCLAKDPDKRYQSIKEVSIELDEIREGLKHADQLHESASQTGSNAASIPSGHTLVPDPTVTSSSPPAALSTGVSSAEYLVQGVKRNQKIVFAAFGLVLLAAAAFAVYEFLIKARPAQSHFEHVKLTRIATDGDLKSVAVAPDGKYIAYSLGGEGKYSLWTKHLATGSLVQIVTPVQATAMAPHFFSHDGSYVFYMMSNEQNPEGALFQVAVLGGTSKKILANVQSTVALSPDGKQLAFGRYHPGPSEQYELWLANADGTNERRLRTFSEPAWLDGYGVAWSPDAKLIALDYGSEDGGEHMSLIEVSVADGSFKVITPHRWNQVARGAWFGDGSGLAVVARESATSDLQIWRVSYPEGVAQRITNDLSSYGYFSLTMTADSRTLVALQEDTSANIWIAPDGDSKRARALTVLRKNVQEHGGEFTPDGHLLFKSNVGGGFRIWLMNGDGTGQTPMTEPGEDAAGVKVSPDGRYFFYASMLSKTRQIWRKDIDGSHPKQLTDGTGADYFSLTPDGRYLLYNLQTPGIWKVSVDGGTPVKVSEASAHVEEVSPDGKLLAYLTEDEQTKRLRLVVVKFDDGAAFKALDWPALASTTWRWSPDSSAFTYINTQSGISNLWRLPIDGTRPTQITDFKSDVIRYFSYSRDGHQLAFVRGYVTRDAVLITDEN